MSTNKIHEESTTYILIGITNYPNENKLSGSKEDINCVKAEIERNGEESVNFDVKMLLDVQASGEVMHAIEVLFAGNSRSYNNRRA